MNPGIGAILLLGLTMTPFITSPSQSFSAAAKMSALSSRTPSLQIKSGWVSTQPATPLSWNLKGIFEPTWCPSRALNSSYALLSEQQRTHRYTDPWLWKVNRKNWVSAQTCLVENVDATRVNVFSGGRDGKVGQLMVRAQNLTKLMVVCMYVYFASWKRNSAITPFKQQW